MGVRTRRRRCVRLLRERSREELHSTHGGRGQLRGPVDQWQASARHTSAQRKRRLITDSLRLSRADTIARIGTPDTKDFARGIEYWTPANAEGSANANGDHVRYSRRPLRRRRAQGRTLGGDGLSLGAQRQRLGWQVSKHRQGDHRRSPPQHYRGAARPPACVQPLGEAVGDRDRVTLRRHGRRDPAACGATPCRARAFAGTVLARRFWRDRQII